ncbi:MAG: dihydrodipicolinate synthase family protein [Acidimicrobiia bacterium]
MTVVRLARADRSIEDYRLGTFPTVQARTGTPRSRVVYAAAHVVADPLGDPVGTSAIDWEATLAFRHHLWRIGFGVAEAMDTAQRGMGLGVDDVRILIERSLAEAASVGGAVVCGVTTDDLSGGGHSLSTIEASYLDQVGFVQERGGAVVLMASRALAATAGGPDYYARMYGRVLDELDRPAVIHWLGPMFDPALDGYWGSRDPYAAMHNMVEIISAHADRVDGVKVSMLDEALECELRRTLPPGVRCYTGDDFNFPTLIAGDGSHHSDALLGIFDGIAPVAMSAFHALDDGDVEGFHRILAPTLPLSRHIFETPTYHYKTGLTFLAYLNGHQRHFRMLGGQEGARSIIHLSQLVRLADAAGLFSDPEAVAARLRPLLSTAGID